MEAVDLKSRLEEFYQVASEVLRDVPEITEPQVKHWIVNPFLVSLGWDPHDKKQVFLDYPLKPEGHADYALLDAEGRPRMLLEVGRPGGKPSDATSGAAHARSVNAPLLFLTNGVEFSLYFVTGKEEKLAPVFLIPLKELGDHAESLLGLTADYRLNDTGVHQLRRSAIRLAVLRFLEENSEKTFDAIAGWVSSQVSPGSLDDVTEQAIRDATMLWLSEEHASGMTPDGKRLHDLRTTTAKDWEPFPRGPPGAFQYKFDTSKSLDLRQSAKEIKAALYMQGLRTATPTSFGGFYYALRQRAGLSKGPTDPGRKP